MRVADFTSRELVSNLYALFSTGYPEIAASINMEDKPRKGSIEFFVLLRVTTDEMPNEVARIDYELDYSDINELLAVEQVAQRVYDDMSELLESSDFELGWFE